MSKFDFESVVRQEEAYLRLVHPTPDDIPGCISLFDTYLSCNGMRWIKHRQVLFQLYRSHSLAGQSHLQIWG
jgi:hypothetical protein